MLTATIKPKQKESKSGIPANRKTRSFSATLLGYVTCPHLYDDRAEWTTIRPLRATFAGRDTQLAPFFANLVGLGHEAELSGMPSSWDDPTKIECLRALTYATTWQKNCGSPGAAAVSIYIPSLCEPNPSLKPKDVDEGEGSVRFAVLPPTGWVDERLRDEVLADAARCQAIIRHAQALGIVAGNTQGKPLLPLPTNLSGDELLRLVPVATYFARFIDMRSDVPLIPDPAFFVQLYLGALLSRIASLPQTEVSRRSYTHSDAGDRWFFARRRDMLGFVCYGREAMGLDEPVAVMCSEDDLNRVVAEQTQLYYAARGQEE